MRQKTATRSFGAGRREAHDATAFYERFGAPETNDSEEVAVCDLADQVILGDSRDLSMIPANSVALVVTSPPYFAGKEYEVSPGVDGVPGSYDEYLQVLATVFAECHRVLEPGGRIAVNVANLGRKPYRSLSGDVVRILSDTIGFLLRGEVVWVKAKGANGSTAWGSYASPVNPVLRDVTERIVIAAKGRFDRAISRSVRKERGLPHLVTITAEEFRELTLDTWYFAPESARRVGHPAPFPVELPRRLIELYTFADDLVLDPFAGSGSTGMAAIATGRRYLCVDNDPAYVEMARSRLSPS